MNIRNRGEIKQFASARLEHASQLSRIILIYAGLTLGLAGVNTVISYVLDLQMESLTGLSSFGKRTTLASIQSMLPLALSMFTMCVETGFLAVMLRIARGQYASEQTLRLGFDRFWVLLRCNIFMGFRFAAMLFLSIYFGVMLFMTLPVSQPAMAVLAPYLADMSALSGEIVMEEAAYAQFAQAVWPAYLICGVIFAIAAIPLWYSYRMVRYIIIDKPGMGALMVMRESRQMMRKNRMALLKLDFGFWWYYLALFAAHVIGYGDAILPMLGVELPGSSDLWYFVFIAAYLAALCAVYYFLRSKVEVSYALVYDALKPEEPKDNGVVLGNIFQM